MRLTYDPEADAAFVYLVDRIGPGEAPRSMICDLEIEQGAVILLFNKDDEIVGLEVLGASRLLPEEILKSVPRGDSA